MSSLADVVAAMTPKGPTESWWTQPALQRAQRLNSQLPAGLSDSVYFEHWLSHALPRVDVIVRVTRAERFLLATEGQRTWLAVAEREKYPWQRVAAFVDEWSRPDGLIDSSVDHIWLEFDLMPERVDVLPSPGVFVDFSAAVYNAPDPTVRAEVGAMVLRALLGAQTDEVLTCSVRRAISAIDVACTVPYLGVLLPRTGAAVRLCINGLDAARLRTYLAVVGWGGDVEAAIVHWNAFGASGAAAPRRSLVHVDISLDVTRGIAFELQCDRATQVRARLIERAWLADLVAQGACSESDAAAMLRWPGCELTTLPHQFWSSLVTRRVNHFKLAISDDGATTVKAYLSASHRHFRRTSPSSVE